MCKVCKCVRIFYKCCYYAIYFLKILTPTFLLCVRCVRRFLCYSYKSYSLASSVASVSPFAVSTVSKAPALKR